MIVHRRIRARRLGTRIDCMKAAASAPSLSRRFCPYKSIAAACSWDCRAAAAALAEVARSLPHPVCLRIANVA